MFAILCHSLKTVTGLKENHQGTTASLIALTDFSWQFSLFWLFAFFFFYRVAGKTDLLQVSAAIVSTKNPNCVSLFFFYVIEQYSCQCLPFTPTFDTLPKIHYCMRCEYQFWLCSHLYLFFFIILFYFFGNKNRWRSQARSICLPRPVLLSVAEGREGREKRKKWEHTLSSLKCHSQLFCPYLN